MNRKIIVSNNLLYICSRRSAYYRTRDIMFSDYQKINENIHCFDYLRDIVTTKGGEVLERNDVINDRLWDTSKIQYVGQN